jgi:hypothetical protein
VVIIQFLKQASLVRPLMSTGLFLLLALAGLLLQTLGHYYKSFDKKVERALQLFSILGFSLLAVNLVIIFLSFQASEDKDFLSANIWLILAIIVSIATIIYCVYTRINLFKGLGYKPKHGRRKSK